MNPHSDERDLSSTSRCVLNVAVVKFLVKVFEEDRTETTIGTFCPVMRKRPRWEQSGRVGRVEEAGAVAFQMRWGARLSNHYTFYC